MLHVQASIQIQRIIRGYIGRRKAWHVYCKKQLAQASHYVDKIVHLTIDKEAHRISLLRHQSAILIQKIYRGHRNRDQLIKARATAERRQLMISRIQVRSCMPLVALYPSLIMNLFVGFLIHSALTEPMLVWRLL